MELRQERPWDNFLFPQVLRSSKGSLFTTSNSEGHLVAGGSSLVEQVYWTLEA